MNSETRIYNEMQTTADIKICNYLANQINNVLTEAENKIWHAHPVWFINGNPIVGYSKQKNGIRLMFGVALILKKKDWMFLEQNLKTPQFFIPTLHK